jgi:hypothetical protein
METRWRWMVKAKPGDHLVIKSHHVGQAERDAEILEVHGEKGQPPFLVRWMDDGHEVLVFPGSDAVVESRPKREHSKP